MDKLDVQTSNVDDQTLLPTIHTAATSPVTDRIPRVPRIAHCTLTKFSYRPSHKTYYWYDICTLQSIILLLKACI